MALVVSNPGDGEPSPAARVLRLDVRQASLGGLAGALRLAPVVADEAVAEGAPAGDRGDAVADAVDAQVRHGAVAAAAAGHLPAGDDGDGAEPVGGRAGQRVRHGAAEAEAHGEALPLVDAEAVLDVRDDRVDEVDVRAAAVAPAVAVALRRDEDGRVVREALQAVVVPDARLNGAPGVDVGHVAAEPVEAEDEAVGPAWAVVVGEADGELAAVDGVRAAGQAGSPSTAGRVVTTGG